jgi:flagellar motor component MotA
MNVRLRIIGFGIVGGMSAWALSAGGRFGMFINVPSLIFVLGLLVGGLWSCFGPKLVIEAFGAGLFGFRDDDSEKLPLYIAVLERAYGLAWASGIVGALIGLLMILADMADPYSIGRGMAICLLPMLYGAFLAEFVFKALQQTLLNHLVANADHHAAPRTAPRSMLALGSVTILMALFAFAAMTLAHTPASSAADVRLRPVSIDIEAILQDQLQDTPDAIGQNKGGEPYTRK